MGGIREILTVLGLWKSYVLLDDPLEGDEKDRFLSAGGGWYKTLTGIHSTEKRFSMALNSLECS